MVYKYTVKFATKLFDTFDCKWNRENFQLPEIYFYLVFHKHYVVLKFQTEISERSKKTLD